MSIYINAVDGLVVYPKSAGVEITSDKLKISDKAVTCTPYHIMLDCLEEDRLSDKKYGHTRRQSYMEL